MTDTQWPEYIVFHQPGADQPHDYAGAVHAPDAELALIHARDVFVRRPECVSLWVVRAEQVFSRTAEQLTADPAWMDRVQDSQPAQSWLVFQKLQHRGTHTHVGEVQAGSPEAALKAAVQAFGSHPVMAWWVVPASAVTRSRPEDIERLFGIAGTKFFRDQSEYHTVTMMRQIAQQKQKEKP